MWKSEVSPGSKGVKSVASAPVVPEVDKSSGIERWFGGWFFGVADWECSFKLVIDIGGADYWGA